MTVKKMSTRPAGADTQVLQAEYTTDFKELQAEFSPRAKGSIALAKSLARNNLPLSRIDRTMSCGDSLAFRRGISQDGELAEISRLHSANFCKDRLCPMCQWRRSRKMYAQMLQVRVEVIPFLVVCYFKRTHKASNSRTPLFCVCHIVPG